MGNPTMVMRYQDQHGIIKAIERCSLQAIFGPDVGSTGDLLPKRPDTSLVVPLKPSRDSVSRPIEKRVYSNKTSFISAEPDIDTSLLPADSTDEDGNVFSDLITNDDIMPVLVTNQESNIPSACSTEPDIVPPSSTREYGMTPFQQSRYLGRVPLEEWGHKIEELRQWTGTQKIYRDIHDLSYSNHKHPNHNRIWDSTNLFCIGCTKDTRKDIADAPNGILPQERVKATQWLRKIASVMTYGIDEPTFLACTRPTERRHARIIVARQPSKQEGYYQCHLLVRGFHTIAVEPTHGVSLRLWAI
ncbi:hypothetical protein IMSHALPRED_009975 [Imshaugia aleurites]|uniref:Uncharacterized protein n=1 Tax=Imshaugia aleurites TaxID=172621 RepID=A0A8H3I1C9_9LECA|nr:hypothetical protein IMSHALPRED_009975 [Imshaugia aleurites]